MKGSAQLLILQDYIKTLPNGVAEVKAYIGSSNAYADLAAGASGLGGCDPLPNLPICKRPSQRSRRCCHRSAAGIFRLGAKETRDRDAA